MTCEINVRLTVWATGKMPQMENSGGLEQGKRSLLREQGRTAGELFGEARIISITFAESKLLPVRAIVSRSRCRPTGKYPSWKMGRMMQWESTLELNVFRLLDCDARVELFVEQPCEIVYAFGPEVRRHYPDVLVQIPGENQLWEIKSACDAARTEIKLRTHLLTEGLKTFGYSYRLVTQTVACEQPRLNNATLLLQYGQQPVNQVRREWVRVMVSRNTSLTWGAARAGRYGKDGRQLLCRLTLEGMLTVDMDRPISDETLFTSARERV